MAADNAPTVRPLTLSERWTSTLYGMAPSGLVLLALKATLLYISGPELTTWEFVRYVFGFTAGLDEVKMDVFDVFYLPQILAKGTYAVFYFSAGRSMGHMMVKGHIVDARTGGPMRTWQKAVRSGLQIVNGYGGLLRILDLLSVVLVMIDGERRRSMYDLIANTVVVVGNPAEEEARG